ncbi:type II toxin-antitoxin system RelE/ParE family toxin [Aminipila luticellarii]|uniref:Type II toxin-antitoxin system RelE/ParE family toxin n=1 Tax=Aminipila luticellarii TaxID=2507160 RepID=A0A410PSP4_9FIRM|nr:type II toxin-antitoxin system RelE/ParE family toxin [Aminipila luticellarii]QAT41906.1 hypothetical protein EQM06_00955 [Aminipila luticellarii]
MNVLSGPKEWNTLKRPNIYFHDEAYKELNELMMQSSCSKKIYALLETRIEQLEQLKANVFMIKEFEKLKNANGLCAMHIKVKDANIRVLFSMTKNNDYMLHAFYKKSGKKATDYAKHISIALARQNEMEE